MVVLIWVGVFLALFYRWLCGGWFARVLMCMLLIATFGVIGLISPDKTTGTGLIFGPIGAILGWVIGSVPVWVWRERTREIVAAENRNTLIASANHEAPSHPYYRY